MKQAIKKAREGGYTKFDDTDEVLYSHEDDECGFKVNGHFLLDPLFWQALGKAEGWQRLNPPTDKNIKVDTEWQYQWHRLIDHLAEGKDVDSFFNNLLK